MKVSVFIILMVIQAMMCEKTVIKLRRKLIVPNMNDKCKKIKCAPVDDPQCVRMRRQDLSLTIHVIAANKCEMEYVKCHDDVEAKIVPMKYCSHNVDQTAGKKTNKTGKAHIRIKRRISENRFIQRQNEASTTDEPKAGYKDNKNKSKHAKLKQSQTSRNKISLKRKNENSNLISKGNDKRSTKKAHGEIQHARQAQEVSSEIDPDEIAGQVITSDEGDTDSSKQRLQSQLSQSILYSQENTSYVMSKAEGLKKLCNKQPPWTFPLFSGEADHISKESLNEEDKGEFNKLRPSVCPSRDVMICAKCQHGIYRTFLSVCQLRMFKWDHPEESMLLVSRYPCVMSASYMWDTFRIKGGVVEPGDDDKVLRFIKCRSEGKLGTNEDPRCSFQDKNNLFYEDHDIQYRDSEDMY